MIENKNVFIEFQILKNSKLSNLITELDVLIANKKLVFIWSKTELPQIMKLYCNSIEVPIPITEVNTHKEVRKLKAQGKTYKEIVEKTGVPIKEMAYFLKYNPSQKYFLSDWIIDYYKKDSSIYGKVDIIIDNDHKIIDRFLRANKEAYLIEKV